MITRASLRRIIAKMQQYQQARIAQMTPEERLELLTDMVDAQAAQLPQEQAHVLRDFHKCFITNAVTPTLTKELCKAAWNGTLNAKEWEDKRGTIFSIT